MKLRQKLVLIFIISHVFFGYSVHKISLNDGTFLYSNFLIYKDNIITTLDQTIFKDEVSHITMNISKDEEKSSISLGAVTHEVLLTRAKELKDLYPDAGRFILLDEGHEIINSDGTSSFRSRYALQILNERSLEYAHIALYNKIGKVTTKLIFARSISPDGSVKYLDIDTLTSTTPSRGSEFYSNDLDVSILQGVIPGVQVGSIVDYEIERTIHSVEDKNQHNTQWFFNSTEPVYESIFTMEVPKSINYFFYQNNLDKTKLKEETINLNNSIRYVFSYNLSEGLTIEAKAAPTEELLASIYGSRHKDQAYLSSWLSIFFKERMKSDKIINEKIEELISSCQNEEEIIAKLYHFMQHEIKYLSIKTSLSSGLAGHKATETFKNRYGDCIDKSILFATMLKECSIEAYPVIVKTNDNARPLFGKIGTLDGNHAINEIHLKDGRIIYLDSTGRSYRYPYFRTDDHGIDAWNPLKNTIRSTGFPNVEENGVSTNLSISLNKDGSALITETVTVYGAEEVRFREFFGNAQKDRIESTMQYFAASRYFGSVLDSYELNDPTDMTKEYSYSFKYLVPRFVLKSGPYLIVNVSDEFGFDFITPTKRNFDIRFSSVLKKDMTFTLTFPEELQVSVPESAKYKSSFLSYEGSYTLNDNSVSFIGSYIRDKALVKASDYNDLRNICISINDFLVKPLIFTAK